MRKIERFKIYSTEHKIKISNYMLGVIRRATFEDNLTRILIRELMFPGIIHNDWEYINLIDKELEYFLDVDTKTK